MSYYVQVLKKYAEFSGRARRAEYWYFQLFNFLASVTAYLIGLLISNDTASLLNALYSLAVLIPSLAVLVRRLHDTGRSGWWVLISLIPLIGAIILLVFTIEDSQPGDNAWGPSPKPYSYAIQET